MGIGAMCLVMLAPRLPDGLELARKKGRAAPLGQEADRAPRSRLARR
jgi:hypothetical protein